MATPHHNHGSLMRAIIIGMLLVGVLGCQPSGEDPEGRSVVTFEGDWSDREWTDQVMAWREARLNRLLAVDGYLALSGLSFLEGSEITVGQSDAMDLVMPAGPPEWGRLILSDETAWFVPHPGADITIQYPAEAQSEAPVGDAIRLVVEGGNAEPSRVGVGDVHFYLATRKNQWVARSRDPNSQARSQFVGLDYFPLNRDFQVVGQFEAHPDDTTIPTATVLGEIIDEPNPGRVIFELGGQVHTLEAIGTAAGDQFFFIFADRTSGRSTYGLGRFLYSALPNDDGEVVLDFNRAYNPPCAFNAFTTCPLPPAGNRIDFPIEAGEQTYRGEAGQDPDQLPLN